MSTADRLKMALNNASNMEEFLNICSSHYDFKNAKLGPIVKATLINNIGKVITMSGAKPKQP